MIKNIKGECDQDKTDPHDAIIWNNSDIKIEGQPIVYKSWHKAGINKVKHLFQQNSGKFMTYEEFINRYKVKSSLTLYYGLLSSIESKWKITTIQRQRQTGNPIGMTMLKIFPTPLCTGLLSKTNSNLQLMKRTF